MTTSTSGYRSVNCCWISPASRSMAARTSAAPATGSDRSRKAQASPMSGMSAVPAGEEARELLAHFRMPQAELDRRFQVAEFGAAIVALAADAHRHHALTRQQRGDGVRKLYLAAAARSGRRKHVENRRREHVAPDNPERRRRILGRRLFDDGVYLSDIGLGVGRTDDTVAAGTLPRNVLDAQQRTGFLLEAGRHGGNGRGLRVDQVVCQQDREGFVANHRARAKNGMSETKRFRLADIDALAARRQDGARDLQQLAFVHQRAFELRVHVEMI